MTEQEGQVAFLTPSRAADMLLFSLALFCVLFLLWAGLAPIDVVTRGQGEVIPSSEAQIVQSLEGGIVQEILVSEGQAVTKGQVLLRLRDIAFASEERGTEAQVQGLELRRLRLKAEAEGKDFSVPAELKEKIPQISANEEALFVSRKKELANALEILNSKIAKVQANIEETRAGIGRDSQNLGLLQEELKITTKMVAQKAMPKMEELRVRKELNQVQGSLSGGREKLSSLEAELRVSRKELEDQRDKFRTQVLGELNETETRYRAMKESLTSIGDKVERAALTAPVDGVINHISVKTIGGVVEPAKPLMEIIPSGGDLKVRAKVSPNEIAFLHNDQPVRVKVTAYDAQKYGSLQGRVARVGSSTVSDDRGNVYFEVDVVTDKNHLGTAEKPLPITPGMLAQVDIITDQRTILEYLLKPVYRAFSEGLRER
ncbi:MAG: HlyD family type I secretion periplasmic adaptor subunit [Alphaproteobacteria bacterium]|nr:HlyD family type I secretion periplasmic adaptor subunit [Alphaproteobacteria bacterium]